MVVIEGGAEAGDSRMKQKAGGVALRELDQNTVFNG